MATNFNNFTNVMILMDDDLHPDEDLPLYF